MDRHQKNFNALPHPFHFFFPTVCLLLLISAGGCTTLEERYPPPDPNQGQITLFLNGPDEASLDITFELSAVNIEREDGTAVNIMDTPRTISSLSLVSRQMLLSEGPIPEGKYKKLTLIIGEALLKRKNRAANLSLPEEAIDLEIDGSVERMQNMSLFIKWNADTSVSDGYEFSPSFSVSLEGPELNSLLMYVTNEGSNNVSVINRQSGETVGTVMVKDRPRGIAAGLRNENQKVYVANSGSNSISVIDPNINKVENEIPIRFGREPEGVVINRSPREKELLFVANYGSNNVSVIDTASQQETENIRVGTGPIAIAADPPVEALTGSRFLSIDDVQTLQAFREKYLNVYVANKNSNDISVLRMDMLHNRCEEVVTIKVEWSPVALEVDYEKGKVYVANYNSDSLSVIDILQIIKGNTTGALTTLSRVGTTMTGVLSDPALDRIYLLNETGGKITIVRPFTHDIQSSGVGIPHIMGTIDVGDLPRSFAMDPEERMIYAVNRGANTVSAVNKTTKKQEKVIPVGMRPYGIAILSQ